MTINSFAISFLSRGVWILLQFFSTRLIFGSLGVEGYGVYAFIFAFVSLGVFCDFGLGRTLQQSLNSAQSNENFYLENLASIFWFCWILGACIIYLLISCAASLHLININNGISIFLISILGAGYGAVQLYIRALNGLHQGTSIYFIQVIFGTFFLVLVISAKFFQVNISPAQYAFAYYFLYLTSYYILGSHLLKISCRPYFFSLSKKVVKWLYESRLFLAYIAISIATTQLDSFYLGLSLRFEELAYYSLVSKIFLAICYSFTYVFFTTCQPLITRHFSQDGTLGLHGMLVKMLLKALMGVALFTAIFEVFKVEILRMIAPTLAAEMLSNSWIYWFYGYFALRTVLECLEFFCIAVNRPKIPIKIGAYLAISVAICLSFFIDYYGLVGMVQGLSIFYTVAIFFYISALRKFFIKGSIC